MSEQKPGFYLVWCEGGNAPTMQHREYEAAAREAKRLSRQNPVQRFTVMAAVRGFELMNLKVTEYENELADCIPF